MMIEAGTIAKIHGLISPSGKELNGKRVLVVNRVPVVEVADDDNDESQRRWVVRIEKETDPKATKCVKPENLEVISERLPLPVGYDRGMAHDMSDMDTFIPKLCELLVRQDLDTGYSPSEIEFMGYASMALERMGEENFMCFDPVRMEQMGGVLALANLCVEGEAYACEDVLFGLLEGPTMYVDVLMQTLYGTGCIVPSDDPTLDDMQYEFDTVDPINMLTPDQESEAYVCTMSKGPMLLLQEMSKHRFGSCLWRAMELRSPYYHLLIQRLLRFVAREALGTRDGKKLGPMARSVLKGIMATTLKVDIVVGDAASSNANRKQNEYENNKTVMTRLIVTEEVARSILENVGSVLTSPDQVTTDIIKGLFTISS